MATTKRHPAEIVTNLAGARPNPRDIPQPWSQSDVGSPVHLLQRSIAAHWAPPGDSGNVDDKILPAGRLAGIAGLGFAAWVPVVVVALLWVR